MAKTVLKKRSYNPEYKGPNFTQSSTVNNQEPIKQEKMAEFEYKVIEKKKKPKADLNHEKVYVIPTGGDLEKARKFIPKGVKLMHRSTFDAVYDREGASRVAKFCGKVGGIRIYDTHIKREVNEAALAKGRATYAAEHGGKAFIRAGFKPGSTSNTPDAQYKKTESESLPGWNGTKKGRHVVNGRWVDLTAAEKEAKNKKKSLLF